MEICLAVTRQVKGSTCNQCMEMGGVVYVYGWNCKRVRGYFRRPIVGKCGTMRWYSTSKIGSPDCAWHSMPDGEERSMHLTQADHLRGHGPVLATQN